MWRMIPFCECVVVVGLLGLVGCVDVAGPKWEIAAENLSDAPCTIVVELAGGMHREGRADALAPGTKQVLLTAGDKVIVRTIKLRRHGENQEVKRNIEVPPGKRFLVTVSAEGQLQTSLADR